MVGQLYGSLGFAGEVERAAKPSGDLREDSGGAGAPGPAAHELHVFPSEFRFSSFSYRR